MILDPKALTAMEKRAMTKITTETVSVSTQNVIREPTLLLRWRVPPGATPDQAILEQGVRVHPATGPGASWLEWHAVYVVIAP